MAKKKAVDQNPAKGQIYTEQATSQLLEMLTRLPDVDEVLKKAGIRRDRLRALMSDDEISQAFETRQDALTSTPWRLEPSEGDAAVFIELTLKKWLDSALNSAFQARPYGYSVIEAVYEQTPEGLTTFKFLGEKPFEWFEPKSDGRLIYYPSNGVGGTTGVEVDQQYKFFLTRCKATYRQPYGEALLSRLYWPWFFRTNGWKFWAKFLERFGSPLLVGKSRNNAAMRDALLNAHSQAVIAIDLNDSIDTVGAGQSANGGQAFDTFEQANIRRIQKVILGQTLTSGTDGSGSRALGDVHDSVRMDKRNSDIKLVTPTIQAMIDALCELNGFEIVKIVFGDETGIEAGRAKRDVDLYATGVRFTRKYYEDIYSLRPEDFEVVAVADAQPVDQKTPIKPPAATKASFLQFDSSKPRNFTAAQQQIEDLSEHLLNRAVQPISPAKMREVVLSATSYDDLTEKLFALVGNNVSTGTFNNLLENALLAVDVLGFVHAEVNE